MDLRNQNSNGMPILCQTSQGNFLEFRPDIVSAVNFCQSSQARNLCIFDIVYKLQNTSKYDIGGTYKAHSVTDLEFYFTTTILPSNNYLLNLFACHRNIGSFKISICDPNSPDAKNYDKILDIQPDYATLPRILTSKVFSSSEMNENHFIQCFHFSDKDIKKLDKKTLLIPLEIESGKCLISDDLLMWIKRDHYFKEIFKREENTDFNLVSKSGTSYATHRLLLCAHSPVFRELIKNSKSNTVTVDLNDDDMKLLLEFMYTGTIQDIENKDWHQILELAGKYQVQSLCLLTEVPMQQNINKNNAVNLALLSEKYKLEEIQKLVFDFIKKNPSVLETEEWNNLNDVVLTKKLLKNVFCDTK